MPGQDLVELMRREIRNTKSLLQFPGFESLAQLSLEPVHAMLAMPIVPLTVSCANAIHVAADNTAQPSLQLLAPMRIVQARTIPAHAADAVSLVGKRLS